MQTTERSTLAELAGVSEAELEAMVGPDPLRPSRSRWRLYAKDNEMPIWAVIGHLGAIAGTTDLERIDRAAIEQLAEERDISVAEVAAALHYYQQNRCLIDDLLEANEAAVLRPHERPSRAVRP